MADFSDFYPYILPSVPGALESLVDQHIRDICLDFCTKTLIVQKTLDPVETEVGVADYDLAPPADMRVHLVLQAWLDRRELSAFNADSPHAQVGLFNAAFNDNGYITGLVRNDDLTFTLNAIPTEVQTITMRAALKPTRDAETVDDLLFNDYAFEIGQGVLSRLMRIPKQPFTDPASAKACEVDYIVARNAALIRANKLYSRSSDMVQLSGNP
jgi:hypothetical protein